MEGALLPTADKSTAGEMTGPVYCNGSIECAVAFVRWSVGELGDKVLTGHCTLQ